MDRLINMVMRQVIRQVVNRGINAGVKAASGSGKGTGTPVQNQDVSTTSKQAARMMRRVTRF